MVASILEAAALPPLGTVFGYRFIVDKRQDMINFVNTFPSVRPFARHNIVRFKRRMSNLDPARRQLHRKSRF